jgi:HAD superfamily hydrolase (TIGR01549 family)
MKSVQALFFDLDSTLLDSSGFQESIVGTCRKIAKIQRGLHAARLVEMNGDVWQSYWPQVEDQWTLGSLDGASVSLEAWRRTLRACGCKDDSMALLASQTHLQLGRETYRLFDDVGELFTALKSAGIPLALITNGASDTQREKLRVLEIERWFDAVVISGEIGIAKPDVFPFDLALNKLKVEPDKVWHVGDSLTADVAGAKAAGLTAVWLNRRGVSPGEGDPLPDVEISSLSNLKAEIL